MLARWLAHARSFRAVLEIVAAGFDFVARFEEERRAADRRRVPGDPAVRGPDHPLPLERRVELDPLGRPRARHRAGERDLLPGARASSLLYPGGISETELLFPYGHCDFASKAGRSRANHFATVVEGHEQLPELGRLTLWEGAQAISFREPSADRLASFIAGMPKAELHLLHRGDVGARVEVRARCSQRPRSALCIGRGDAGGLRLQQTSPRFWPSTTRA